MKTSDNGINLIKQFEGLKLKAYKCPAGIMTIGYGSTRWLNGTPIKENDVIDEATAEALLQNDLKRFEDVINKLVKARINQNQFDALVCFTYNIGDYALKKSTLLQQLNDNVDKKLVAEQFLRWNKANGEALNGLTRRRQAERDLFLK